MKTNKRISVKKLAISGVFIAVGVVCSAVTIPVGAAKCAPVQHMINIMAAAALGPYYGVMLAFVTSLLRNMMGLGSLLAFPGSMFGALLAGMLYRYTGKLTFAYIGELFGTAVIGGIVSYPIAAFLMGNAEAALFTYVIPFFISSAGGTVIAALVLTPLSKTGMLKKITEEHYGTAE